MLSPATAALEDEYRPWDRQTADETLMEDIVSLSTQCCQVDSKIFSDATKKFTDEKGKEMIQTHFQ